MPTKPLTQALVLAGILFVTFTCPLAQEQSTAGEQAVTPEKRALIAELLEVTNSKKTALAFYNAMLDQQQNQMPDVIWQSLSGNKELQGLSSDEKARLRKQMLDTSARSNKRLRELFSKRIDFTQIVEDIAYDQYSKYFTEAEIRDLVTFYRSPTGQKSIELSPKMFAESMTTTMERINPKVLEIMTELSTEEAERIKKEFQASTSKQPMKPKPTRRSRKHT
jgi:uncharacterized protein